MLATLTQPENAFEHCELEPGQDYLLLEAVINGFRHSGYRALSNLKCEVFDGEVVISGVVPSYFLKQIAQTIVLRIGRIKGMKNHLQVNPA